MRIDNPSFQGTSTGTVASASTAITSSYALSRNATLFSWDSHLAHPSSSGGVLYNNAIWDNFTNGVRLTTTTIGSNGTIYWNLTGSNGFDFRRDFRATYATYYGGTYGGAANGDGHFFNFGGTGSSATSYGATTKDSSLSITYDPYINITGSNCWINGDSITPTVTLYNGSELTNSWVKWAVEVRQNPRTNQRLATLILNTTTQWTLDVTSWSPSGSIFTVGAWCGGATANQYVRTILLEQI